MFDVLELHVPGLAPEAGLVAQQRETAWGPSDDVILHWNGVPFARHAPQAATRAAWTGLTLAEHAGEAAASDAVWERYLSALRAVLDAHSDWIVLVEAACDQYPIESVSLTTSEVIDRLDAQRRSPRSDFAARITRARPRWECSA